MIAPRPPSPCLWCVPCACSVLFRRSVSRLRSKPSGRCAGTRKVAKSKILPCRLPTGFVYGAPSLLAPFVDPSCPLAGKKSLLKRAWELASDETTVLLCAAENVHGARRGEAGLTPRTHGRRSPPLDGDVHKLGSPEALEEQAAAEAAARMEDIKLKAAGFDPFSANAPRERQGTESWPGSCWRLSETVLSSAPGIGAPTGSSVGFVLCSWTPKATSSGP